MTLQGYINEAIEITRYYTESDADPDSDFDMDFMAKEIEKIDEIAIKAKKTPNFKNEIVKWKDKNIKPIPLSFIFNVIILILKLDMNDYRILLLQPSKIAKFYTDYLDEILFNFHPEVFMLQVVGWDNFLLYLKENKDFFPHMKSIIFDMKENLYILDNEYINSSDILFVELTDEQRKQISQLEKK